MVFKNNIMKVKISHTILYIKGWYRTSDDILEDLRATLQADGYSADLFTNDDVINVLLNRFEDCNFPSHSLSQFVKATKSYDDENYYQKVIEYVFEKFIWLDNEDWEIIPPDFNKVLPLHNSKNLKQVKGMFKDFK